MDQMQNTMLYMLQAMTASQTDTRREVKSESGQESEFRKLLDKRTAQEKPRSGEEKIPQEETAPSPMADGRKEEELDSAALQELAAMQMFCADRTQIVVVTQEAAPEQAMNELPQMDGKLLEGVRQAVPVELSGKQAPVAEQTLQGEQTQAVETMTVVESAENAPETGGQGESLMDKPQGEPRKMEVHGKETGKVSVKHAETPTEGTEAPVFSRVESTPIKVSETTAAAGTEQTQSVETQLADQLTEAISNGETKVEVQLMPENLGKVTIELTQKEDGSLHIALHAENSSTRTLLERELPNLQNLLGRDTQQEVQVEVPRQQETQQKDYYDGHQRQNRQQQEQRRNRQSSEDFLNQLRLGLIPAEEAAS